jgi:pimeloyl-ACP methyl ester carboxylesterase
VAPEKAAKKGFRLLCYPFRTRISAKHHAFFNTAEKFAIACETGEVQAYRWGSGKIKVLFLHGWQSHSYLWKTYIESLDQSRYTLYAFDAPGHGLSAGKFLTMPSYSDVIQCALREIGPADYIVAHSIGSFAALHAFYVNPRITPSSIVLLSSPGRVQEFFDFFRSQLSLTEKCIGFIVQEFEKLMCASIESFAAAAYASSLQINGLLIHDELDKEISVRHSYEIHEHWKNSVLITTTGKGHNLRSQEVVDMVVGYIKEGKV